MSTFSVIPDFIPLLEEIKQNPSYKKRLKKFPFPPDIEYIDEDQRRMMKWISIFIYFCPQGRSFETYLMGDPSFFLENPSLKLRVVTIDNPINFLPDGSKEELIMSIGSISMSQDRINASEQFLFFENDVAVYKSGSTEIKDDWNTIAHLALFEI
jgi:hypothetical protein